MDPVSRLLLERARHADESLRIAAAADLDRLRRLLPAADRDFEPERADSRHDYDVFARIRYLEAVSEGEMDFDGELRAALPVALDEADLAEFRDAVSDVEGDQRWLRERLEDGSERGCDDAR
jgi:hypothetical protein